MDFLTKSHSCRGVSDIRPLENCKRKLPESCSCNNHMSGDTQHAPHNVSFGQERRNRDYGQSRQVAQPVRWPLTEQKRSRRLVDHLPCPPRGLSGQSRPTRPTDTWTQTTVHRIRNCPMLLDVKLAKFEEALTIQPGKDAKRTNRPIFTGPHVRNWRTLTSSHSSEKCKVLVFL